MIDIFRVTDSIKESLMQLVVLGSNATLAHIRSRKPDFAIRPPAIGTLISQTQLVETYSAAEDFINRCKDQLFSPVLDMKDELET